MTGLLRRWVRSAVDVREGERPVVALMFGYGFLALTSYYVIKPVRNSIFVDRVGADQLPFVYILTAVFVIALMVVYSRYVERVGRLELLLWSLGALSAVLVGFWWLLRGGSTFWTSGAFYIFGKLYPLILVSQFWLVANLLFSTSQARRLFGPIGVGLILGGVAGSVVSGAMAEVVGSEALLLIAVGILGVCALIILRLAPEMGEGSDASGRLTEEVSGSAVALLRRSSHLKTIALILGVTIVVGTLIDWQFNRAVEIHVVGEDAKTRFFGTFFGVLNVASVAVQVLFTGWVLRRFGLQVALLVLPLGLTVATAGVLAVPVLLTASLAKGTEGALRYSLDQATRELLYLPVPLHVKYKVKPLIDLAVYRGGTGVGGVLLLVAVNGLGFSIRQVGFLTLAALVVWVGAALRMRREFGRSLKRLIGVRDVKLEELVVGHLNAETLDELRRTLREGDEERILYALTLLEQAPSAELAGDVRALLRHHSERIRSRALAVLSDMSAAGHADEVEPLLRDPSLEVRSEAVRYVCEFGPGDPSEVMEEFLADDSEVRVAAVGCLLRYGGREARNRAVAVVRELARSADPADRRTAAALLGRLEDLPADLVELLEDLVRDPEVAVCHQAMRAAGSSRVRRLAPVLLDRLAEPAYRGPARAALEAYGPEIHSRILDRLEDETTPEPLRTTLPGLLVPDAGQETVDRLAGLLGELGPAARYEALKALNKLRRERPDLAFERVEMEPLVRREVELAYHFVVLGAELGGDGAAQARAGGRDDSGQGGTPAERPERSGEALLLDTLSQRRSEAVERAFRTLGLQHDPEDLYAAYTALESPEKVTRERGFELVETVLPLRYRRLFDPLLDPDAERDRLLSEGRRRLAAGERSREGALETLVCGPDLWLSALAHRVRGGTGLPPGRGAGELEAHMRAASLLADRTSLDCDEVDIMEIVQRAEFLAQAKIFADVRTEDLAAVATLVEERDFGDGETLFEEGEPGGTLFLVTGGAVEARKDGRVLFTAGPGRSVGSLSLLDGRPTNYTAVALEPTRTLLLGREEFAAALEERQQVAESVIRYLTGVVRGLNEAPDADPEDGSSPGR